MDDIDRLRQLAGLTESTQYISDLLDDLSQEQMFYLIQALNKKHNLRQEILDWRWQNHIATIEEVPTDAQMARGHEKLKQIADDLKADARAKEVADRRGAMRIV